MTLTQKLLSRCDAGWTLAQKWGLTALLLVYWISPIDFAGHHPGAWPMRRRVSDLLPLPCLAKLDSDWYGDGNSQVARTATARHPVL